VFSLLSVYWKTLILSSETYEMVRVSKNGLWLSLRIFILVALIAGSAGLVDIVKEVDQPTLAERIDVVARRVEDIASLAPWILGDLLSQIAQAIDQVVEKLESFQPPLGVRPSRMLRLFGNWLQRPLDWLVRWLSLALLTWLIGRLMGGKAGIREHFSLALLAVAPLVLLLPSRLLADALGSGVMLSYLAWAFELVIWLWCVVILVKALSIAQSFPLDHAIATLILSGLMTLASLLASITLFVILLINLF
jgi:AcrR family transcriptional regulator